MTTEVFDAAVAVAQRVGYRNVTRRLLAEQLGKSEIWLMNHHKQRDTLAELTRRADELGLKPGNRSTDRSGVWRDSDRLSIITTAYVMVKRDGYAKVTRPGVARAAGFSPATISNYFGAIGGLLDEVVTMAIRNGDAEVLMQALAAGSEVAKAAPAHLKRQASKMLD